MNTKSSPHSELLMFKKQDYHFSSRTQSTFIVAFVLTCEIVQSKEISDVNHKSVWEN